MNKIEVIVTLVAERRAQETDPDTRFDEAQEACADELAGAMFFDQDSGQVVDILTDESIPRESRRALVARFADVVAATFRYADMSVAEFSLALVESDPWPGIPAADLAAAVAIRRDFARVVAVHAEIRGVPNPLHTLSLKELR